MHGSDIVVGISGLDSGLNPHPGTAVAMALKRDPEFKGRLIGLAYDPILPGAFMDQLFDDFALIPWPGDHESHYLRSLTEVRDDLGLNVLLPCLDSDLPTVSRVQDELSRLGISSLVPRENAVKDRFKWNLSELASRVGIETPRTSVLYDTGQLHPLDGWSWPLYIKGSLADAYVAHNQDEANYLFQKLARKWGYPVMAQESRAGVEYLVAGVMGRRGLLGQVTVKKGATTYAGKATTGVTVANDKLNQIAAELLDLLSWRGPFELEFMREATSGEFLLIEINGRFPAWISFANEIGKPIVRVAVEEALGRNPSPVADVDPGIIFSRGHMQNTGLVSELGIWRALERCESHARAQHCEIPNSNSELQS